MAKGLVKRRVILAAAFLGLFILLCGMFPLSSTILEYIASYIAYPVLIVQKSCVTPIKSWFAHRRTVEALQDVVRQLQEEKEQLISVIIQQQARESFEADIKEIDDFKRRYDYSRSVLAQVLLKNISDQSHFFILDAGKNKGIQKNMVAIYKDTLVGKVIEVYPFYCKVALITDRSCKVSAYCARTKASGIHEGMNHHKNCCVSHVSHLANLEDGDMLISSGDGLVFPRGFALTRIASFVRNELFYEVTTELLVDFQDISYCYIAQKGNEIASPYEDSLAASLKRSET